jgi:hypothetical protein
MNMFALGRNILDHVNMLLITTNLALYIDICIEQKFEIWPWNQNMIVKLFESHAYNDRNWVSLMRTFPNWIIETVWEKFKNSRRKNE